jgi:hypothetical protein
MAAAESLWQSKARTLRGNRLARRGHQAAKDPELIVNPQTTTNQNSRAAPVPQPTEGTIRDYAFHLYEQGGHSHGHDVGYWQEAEACLRANIPKEATRNRMHHHTQITEREALALKKHGAF